jgi:hypothetical protein
MSEEIFKNKLIEIKNANKSSNTPQKWKPNFHDLAQGITAASETIAKTKMRLLQEASNNPSLHLMLYRTDSNGRKILRKWSELLFRLSIAQRVIEISLSGKTVSIEYLRELYPKISETTLKHVLRAVMLTTNDQVIKNIDIIKQLTIDPERYERLVLWGVRKQTYIEMMCKGFLNCHLTLSSHAFRLKNTKRTYVVVDKLGQYGIYTETDKEFGKRTSTVKYVDYHNPPPFHKHPMKYIMDQLRILGPRESMLWFINEIMDTLMFDFEWDEVSRYAQFVYNTLTRVA